MKISEYHIGIEPISSYVKFLGHKDNGIRKKLLLMKHLCKQFDFKVKHTPQYYQCFEYTIFYMPHKHNIHKIDKLIQGFINNVKRVS